MFDYFKWADQYEAEALKIQMIVDLTREELKKASLSADKEAQLRNRYKKYCEIRHDLRECARILRRRGLAINESQQNST